MYSNRRVVKTKRNGKKALTLTEGYSIWYWIEGWIRTIELAEERNEVLLYQSDGKIVRVGVG